MPLAISKELKVLIIGLGSIGKRHIVNLRKLEPAAYTMALRHSRGQEATNLPDEVDAVVYNLQDALIVKPDIALITGPASHHIKMGLALAKQGIHLFIEKPLSHVMDEVDELITVCKTNSLVLMVGYNLRFWQPLQLVWQVIQEGQIGRIMTLRAEVGQYLPDWRPGTDYRRGVSARQELGGGAVLELSHEIDYARWLGGEVKAVSAKLDRVSKLEIDVEDTAECILQFENGAMGSIHLDMVSRPATRTCRIGGDKGTLTWDGLSNQVRLFSTDTNSWVELHQAIPLDRNQMYMAELHHFLECVRENKSPLVNGEEGRKTLALALAIKQSSQEERWVYL